MLNLKEVKVAISDEVFYYNYDNGNFTDIHYIKFPLTYTVSFQYSNGLEVTYECHTNEYLQRPLDFSNVDMTDPSNFEYQGHIFKLASISSNFEPILYEEAIKLLCAQVKK